MEKPELERAGSPVLTRGYFALEDGDFAAAQSFFDQSLNLNEKNPLAYLGILMAQLRVRQKSDLADCPYPFDGNPNYQKAVRFGDDALKNELFGYLTQIKNRKANEQQEPLYQQALRTLCEAKKESDYTAAARIFRQISGYRDADTRAEECETARKEYIYGRALDVLNGAKTENDFNNAATKFKLIPGYRDADEKAQTALNAANKAFKKKLLIVLSVCASVIALAVALLILDKNVFAPNKAYQKALDQMNAGNYGAAIRAFELLNGFKDSGTKINECRSAAYHDAKTAMQNGDYVSAGLLFGQAGDCEPDAPALSAECWAKSGVQHTIAAGWLHTAGVKADGTMIAAGNNEYSQCDVDGWTDVIAVAAGGRKALDISELPSIGAAVGQHTLGLKKDGTVIAAGYGEYGQLRVSDWKNIVSVAAGDYHSVGLKKDGTVVAVGNSDYGQCAVSDWTDIIAVAAGYGHTVGLKKDGSVVAVGNNDSNQCDVKAWTDIIAIAAGNGFTVGVKKDGTVVAVGTNQSGQCDVDEWTDIIAVAAGFDFTVGLKRNGTAVAVGGNEYAQCHVESWTDVVAIAAGRDHTVGLKKDGSVISQGYNYYGQCDTSEWEDIRTPGS